MINRYNGYAPAPVSTKPDCLPAGAYEAIIKGARVEQTQWGGQRLILALDVTEGEHKGHYQKMFDYDSANGNFTPKWKGTIRINIPSGDGSEKDAWTKKLFEGAIYAIEKSNPGYTFDFDEGTLKGKAVGINVRNKEWEYNDMTGWTTEIGRLEVLDDVKQGKVKAMKDRPLQNKPQTADEAAGFTAVETDNLPF